MKKLKIYVFLILWGGMAGKALAVSDLNLSGEMDLAFAVKHLPTRDMGVTSFNLPRLNLDIEVPLRDENGIFVTLETAEFRDATSKRFDTQLKYAYLNLTSGLPSQATLRYGLIPDFYVELQREGWDYDFWGPSSDVPLIRYKYTSWSDLGVMYQGELPGDAGPWALSVTNGEGYQSNELGPRKQVQLLLDIVRWAPFHLRMAYTYGAYEEYDARFNKKVRAALHLSYEFQNAELALEYFQTRDPANAILAGDMAGGVDVSALAGTSVEGQGGSLMARVETGEKTEFFLRGDYLSPVRQEKEKNLKALSTGFSYNTNEDLRWALAYEYTDYSDAFSASIRDESRLVLATRVSF